MAVKKSYLPTKVSISRSIILIVMVLFISILDNTSIAAAIGFSIYSNAIKPLLWCSVLFTIWHFPRIRPELRLKHRSTINWWSFYFGIIYITISMLAGIFIEGLGKSPYSHTPIGILLNVLTVGTELAGREFVRSYWVNNTRHKGYIFSFFFITIFMTAIDISYTSISNLKSYQETVEYMAEYLIPDLVENLFANFLVSLGGPVSSITYLGVVKGFHWLSPILPNLKWITKALIGILCPVFFLMLMKNIYLKITKQVKYTEETEENPVGWIITSILSVFIIWFAVGVFPIYPFVVATGSMEPEIKPGDVILVEKIVDMDGIKALEVGDIILFKRDQILISHRIIEIIENKEEISFKTRGDNNSDEDKELVLPENIKGKVIYNIPKAGLLTLILKSRDDVPLEDMEF